MILKDFTLPNGALTTFHVPYRIQAMQPFDVAMVDVHCYASEEAFLAAAPLMWSEPLQVPLANMVGGLADAVDAWLIGDAASPFYGGTIVADQSETLATAKQRAWSRIKRARDVAEMAPFQYNGNTYDGDADGTRRVAGGAQLAAIAAIAGAPYSTVFTLADNTSITLTGAEMMAVGVAKGESVDATFAIARALRAQIDDPATDSIEKLNVIQWPVPGAEA